MVDRNAVTDGSLDNEDDSATVMSCKATRGYAYTYNYVLIMVQFDSLKGTLWHFSLLPPGGGGILAHSLAYIAFGLKVCPHLGHPYIVMEINNMTNCPF
ncbi:hypothetical protein M8C21_010900 [Ambrosia artemisiifolia]|uniref:Uncharacterized protein n=1 Tax=Ambrosia artemisiifolia TaxID=4212 RepID=A0AAD5D494_AMBAR|nr:hypothetical protein M8C21_010900 [Ambrosia artemisiifolia]